MALQDVYKINHEALCEITTIFMGYKLSELSLLELVVINSLLRAGFIYIHEDVVYRVISRTLTLY
jgi:hypothetical protein